MVVALACDFGQITLFPFVYTAPESIASQAQFLNSVAVIYSKGQPEQVKNQLNRIETRLGRDRTDPQRSHKDRTADIDILGYADTIQLNFFLTNPSEYVRSPANYTAPPADLSQHGLPAFERAATVYLDTGTRNIRIVDKRDYRFVDG